MYLNEFNPSFFFYQQDRNEKLNGAEAWPKKSPAPTQGAGPF
jgi:hypothetical protein